MFKILRVGKVLDGDKVPVVVPIHNGTEESCEIALARLFKVHDEKKPNGRAYIIVPS